MTLTEDDLRKIAALTDKLRGDFGADLNRLLDMEGRLTDEIRKVANTLEGTRLDG